MDIRERIAQANQQAVACIIDSDPYWVDIRPAGECVEGLEDHMILHSGPPVDLSLIHISAVCTGRTL